MASFDLFTLFSDHLKSRGRDVYVISTSTSASSHVPPMFLPMFLPCRMFYLYKFSINKIKYSYEYFIIRIPNDNI